MNFYMWTIVGDFQSWVSIVFQLEYYKHLFKILTCSSSLVFVSWSPFVTIFKCSNLQAHYTFFKVHQIASDIVPILYNKQ